MLGGPETEAAKVMTENHQTKDSPDYSLAGGRDRGKR